MPTLTSVEEAVASLPLIEQEKLLRSLAQRLHKTSPGAKHETREEWLSRLDKLRASVGTGKIGPSTEEILDDLRADRSA
jgi:hypothetical protein